MNIVIVDDEQLVALSLRPYLRLTTIYTYLPPAAAAQRQSSFTTSTHPMSFSWTSEWRI